jgi:MFS family permease
MTVRSLGQLQGLRALRHRNYRLYWTGQLISLIGTWMQQVAQAWLVLSLTNDPLMLGLVATAQYGPVLAFGLFGGVLADALPKRRTIIFTQVTLMVLAIVLGLLTLTGTAQVWHVMLLAVLLGFTGVVDMPTRQSFIFEMVGREDLPNAVALNASIYNGARVVGPAIAGLTIAAVGVPVAFLLNGISFVAVIACLLAMRPSELRPVARGAMPRTVRAVFANLGEGLGYIRRTPPILIAILVLGFVSTAGMNYSVVIPPLARDVLGAGPSGYGFLMSAGGIGSVVAALALAFGRHPNTRSLLAGALALGVLETLLAVSTWMPLSLACMFGMGLGGLAMSMSANTQIQMGVPDQLRGRVMSVYTTIFAGTTPIGGLIFGALASGLGTEPAIAIGGLASVGIALTAVVVAWRWGLIGGSRKRSPDKVAASRPPLAGTDVPVGAPPATGMTGHR